MARSLMRNKLTGELKDVEPDSDEFYELRKQVTPLGQTMWEQTSIAHAEAIKGRATFGELNEEDLGHEDQDQLHIALRLHAEGVAPEDNPHLALTPGEIEAGLTPKQKLEDLERQYDQGVLGKRRAVFSDAADRIADERQERDARLPAKGQLARAGGSDVRKGVPLPEHQDEGEESSSSDSSGSSSAPSGSSSSASSGSSGSSGPAVSGSSAAGGGSAGSGS